ncbi:MAG: redox-sensing transcriptional repressor Rex [Candidatus Zixiibacteriota bacterium]
MNKNAEEFGGLRSVKRRRISDSTIHRLSLYHRLLIDLESQGTRTVSSKQLAQLQRLTPAQVRKDLSFFGAFGTRGLGYPVSELRKRIAKILGLDRRWKVAVVGVGNIGSALVGFKEFPNKGFDIRLVFDNDQRKIGSNHKGMRVSDIRTLKEELVAHQIDLVILAVPAGSAQEIVNDIVEAGVKSILSFAPAQIDTPPGVHVRSEDMSMELEYLTYAMVNNPAQ